MMKHTMIKRGVMSKVMAGLFAGAMLFSGSVAMAGGGHHGDRAGWSKLTEEQKLEKMEEKLDKSMARLTETLSLSNDQATKLRAVFSAAQTEKQDIRQRHQGDRKAARPEFEQLRERTKTQVASILSADQLKAFEQIKREHRGHKKGRKGGRHMGKRMIKALDLNEAQQAQVKTIMESARAERRGLVEAAGGDREAARPQMEQLRERTKAQLRAVLTAEQAAKFDAMKRGRRGGKKGGKD